MTAISINSNSPYISAALAQQQVVGDQAQVQSDLVQLRQDQSQLDRDTERSVSAQQQVQRSQQSQGLQARQAGLDHLANNAQVAQSVSQPVHSVQPAKSTVNTSGQTVGKIINVVA
jgi:hypothetical protein